MLRTDSHEPYDLFFTSKLYFFVMASPFLILTCIERMAAMAAISRVEVSLISYKDHIWFHTVHTWFLSTILVWNQKNHIWSLYDYQEIIYDPSTSTKNHTSIFWKSLAIYIFLFLFGWAYHIYDTLASHCDPPKDPNVQYQLQVGHKIKE